MPYVWVVMRSFLPASITWNVTYIPPEISRLDTQDDSIFEAGDTFRSKPSFLVHPRRLT